MQGLRGRLRKVLILTDAKHNHVLSLTTMKQVRFPARAGICLCARSFISFFQIFFLKRMASKKTLAPMRETLQTMEKPWTFNPKP